MLGSAMIRWRALINSLPAAFHFVAAQRLVLERDYRGALEQLQSLSRKLGLDFPSVDLPLRVPDGLSRGRGSSWIWLVRSTLFASPTSCPPFPTSCAMRCPCRNPSSRGSGRSAFHP